MTSAFVFSFIHTLGRDDGKGVYLALKHSADFFWDLRRSKNFFDRFRFDVEAHLLTESETVDSDSSILVRTGPNLNVGGTVRVYVEDVVGRKNALGFTIRNPSPLGLYVWLFAFNMLDLTISA